MGLEQFADPFLAERAGVWHRLGLAMIRRCRAAFIRCSYHPHLNPLPLSAARFRFNPQTPAPPILGRPRRIAQLQPQKLHRGSCPASDTDGLSLARMSSGTVPARVLRGGAKSHCGAASTLIHIAQRLQEQSLRACRLRSRRTYVS